MPKVKTIKGVDEESWSEFKSIAAKNKMKMGKLFETMVEDYKGKVDNFWDKILEGPPLLSKEEADAMLGIVKKMRSEYGFRKVK